jgi:hypothetical protein
MFKIIKEWIYNKRMIHPSPLLSGLAGAPYLLCPKFFVSKNQHGQEMVFFTEYKPTVDYSGDRTGIEALENHVHIFDCVKKRYRKDVKLISEAIAQNLFRALKLEFPEKKFVVFLELNYKDSVIVRFHQVWENEKLYFDPQSCKKEYDSGRLIMFID